MPRRLAPRPTRCPAAFAVLLIVVGLVAATVGPAPPWTTALAAQDDPAAPAIEIGAGPQGDTALTLVGRAAIDEDGLRLVGYVTRVIGLDPALLATEPGPPTAATARFTFAADLPDARQSESSPSGALATITGDGTLAIYLDEAGGAAFDDPSTFADGTPVAEADLSLTALLLRSPAGGSVTAEGTLTHTAAEPFALAGDDYRFGQVGVGQRLRLVGALAEGEATTANVAGTTAVTGRAPAPTGGATPPAAALGILDEAGCGEVAFWTLGAQVRISRASGNIAVVAGGDDPPRAGTVRGLAAEVATLADEQRAAAIPAAAAPTNRLLVTALRTTSRGLLLLAAAIDADDDQQAAEARAIIADGDGLLRRAAAELPEVATAADCDDPG